MPPAEVCAVISQHWVTPSICCSKQACSTRMAPMPSISVSSSRYVRAKTSSTSTAAASEPPSHIASCPAPRAACMHGRRFGTVPKSSWSRASSTMSYCGRRAFTTSPVRWALISTRSSSTSYAKDRAPSISPSMLMPTRADNKPPNYWPIVLTLKASLLAASCCRRATIPTPSSSRAATRSSFSLSWRPPCHELPRHPPENPIGRTQPISSGRAIDRQVCRLDQPLPGPRVCSPPRKHLPVQLRTQPVALCTLVGERSSHRQYFQGRPRRIDPARLRALPVHPATSAFCHHHQ